MALDPTVPRWPNLLRPKDISDPQLMNATMDSPQPLVGAPQSVLSDAGLWHMKLIDIPVFVIEGGPDLLALWRALFTGRLQQGLAVYMPFRDWRRGPVARGGLPLGSVLAQFSDAVPFSDGTTFGADRLDVLVNAPAQGYATEIIVDVDPEVAALGGTPQGGDFFSINGRGYLIVGTQPTTVTNRWAWNIMPPLRTPLAGGEPVEIRDPVCRMTLHNEDRRKVALTRDLGILGRLSLTFIEDNWT